MMTCLSRENYVVLNRSPPATGGHFNVGHNISAEDTYPRKLKVSGLPSPRRLRLAAACAPFVRDVAIDPGRASAPRIAVPHILPSTTCTASAFAADAEGRSNATITDTLWLTNSDA